MQPRHVLLAVGVAALWGSNFVAVHVALETVQPLFLAFLRFSIAAIPALFVPRPAVSWPRMGAIAATLFIGQFGFLFVGMHEGMPPGLASVLTQAQALITVLLAATFLGETPALRQWAGITVAALGMVLIGSGIGRDGVTGAGLVLTILAAASWAVGNVLLRRVGQVAMFPLVVWLSVIPPLPLLALSLILEHPLAPTAIGPAALVSAAAAIAYIALAATLVGYGLWGHLLKLYPAARVAPFALLVPIFGLLAAWLVVGEQFGTARIIGIAIVFAGLAIANMHLGSKLFRR